MTHRPIFLTLALILIALSFGAQTLSAATDPLTFASFSQQQFNQQAFHLANNGPSGVTFNSAKTSVQFFVDPNAPTTAAGAGYAGQSIDAYLWLSSSTTASAFTAGTQIDQPFDGTTTITIQSVADFNAANTNYLLVAAYQQGDMLGKTNGHLSAEFSSTTVTYTSHYLNFSGASNGELALNFYGLTPSYKVATNGLVASFKAAGGGEFAASFAPEPQTYALFATCFAVLGWKVRHNRRTSKQNEARLQNDKG